MKSKDMLIELLAFTNALSYMYYNFHWKSVGENYYSDHLLYERTFRPSRQLGTGT